MYSSPRVLCSALLVGLLVLAQPEPSRASTQALRGELAKLAADVKKYLDSQDGASLRVQQFTGPSTIAASSGPGINQILLEEFHKLDVNLNKLRGEVGLEGKYLVEADEGKPMKIKIKATLVDKFGKEIVALTYVPKIDDQQTIALMLGTSVDLSKAKSNRRRDQKLKQSFSKPKAHHEEGIVFAEKNSKFAIEIYVDDKACVPKVEEGLAVVPLKRGDVYQVRLINNADHEVAVRLSIDGLSMFAFSKFRHDEGSRAGEPLYSVVFVPPHQHVTIKGWHHDNSESYEFKVVEYAKSAAAELNYEGAQVGTITATFAASWEKGKTPPPDEAGLPKGDPRDGTGRGNRVGAKFKAVEREIGALRATVSVRYLK